MHWMGNSLFERKAKIMNEKFFILKKRVYWMSNFLFQKGEYWHKQFFISKKRVYWMRNSLFERKAKILND